MTSKGEEIKIESRMLNDSKKAASVLGATFRPVEETIRDLIETSIELGIVEPQLRELSSVEAHFCLSMSFSIFYTERVREMPIVEECFTLI